jgi:membrane dipeptidase
MFYLSQPITGLLTKTSQLFSGRVINFTQQQFGLTNHGISAQQKALNVVRHVEQFRKKRKLYSNMKKTCISFFKLLLLTVMLNNASAQSYKNIHNNAIVIDGHNDFFTYAIDSGYQFEQNLTGKTQSDLQRMKEGGIDVQVFCVWNDQEMKQPFSNANLQLDFLDACVKHNPDKMKLVYSPGDLEQAVTQKKFGVMIGVEGGHMIEDDLNKLDSFYKRGVRYMTLT